jgi:hypothetical protein
MVLPAVCLVVTVCVKQHQVGIPAVSPVAVSMVDFYIIRAFLVPHLHVSNDGRFGIGESSHAWFGSGGEGVASLADHNLGGLGKQEPPILARGSFHVMSEINSSKAFLTRNVPDCSSPPK